MESQCQIMTRHVGRKCDLSGGIHRRTVGRMMMRFCLFAFSFFLLTGPGCQQQTWEFFVPPDWRLKIDAHNVYWLTQGGKKR